MGVNLSVLILAKNEEKNIEACIRSALFADEVLVIDDMSSDRTKEIAESLGAKVLQRALNGNWGEQQTFAMQNAQCDWIYCLDADERISHRLAEEISRVVAEDDRRYAYQTARLNYFWEQPLKHGGWFPDHGIRLLPRKGVYVTGFVHPQFHYDGYELKTLPD
ncbi:MAG: glycosyltransferase family 2 protein, partial [Selenomonadaceae bacterium]|nr:glycosyltransferase family 2 protein [Selenomonadaceae bacterium]